MNVLGRSPYGSSILQDDGSVTFLPPELVTDSSLPPPLDAAGAGQFDTPVPDIARDAVAADLQSGAIKPPTQPGLAVDPNAIQMDGEDITADGLPPDPAWLTEGLGGASATPIADPNAVNPDDIEMGDEAAAGGVEPTSAPAGESSGEPWDPYVAQADAELARGALAGQAAQLQNDITTRRDAEDAKMNAARMEAQQKIIDRQVDMAKSIATAVNEQATFEMNKPEPSISRQVRSVISLALGAIGVALERKGNVNPVLAILEKKAEAEATLRARKYQQLKDDTANQMGEYDGLAKMSTSVDAYWDKQKALNLDMFGREMERQAAATGAQDTMLKAQVEAAKIYQLRDKSIQDAMEKMTESERKAAQLQLDAWKTQQDAKTADYNAKTARSNAYTNTLQLNQQDKQFNRTFEAAERQRGIENGLAAEKMRLEALKAGQTDAAADRVAHDVKENLDSRQMPPQLVVTVETDPKTGERVPVETWEPLRNARAPKVDAFGRPVLGPDGKQIVDESEWLAPTAKVRDQLAAKHGAARDLTRLLDDIVNIVEDEGWSSDTLKSTAWLKAKQAWSEAAVKYKGPEFANLGVIAGADMDLIGGALGTKDPTQMRSNMAGVKQARANVVKSVNSAFRSEGNYTGKPIDFPNPGALAKADQTRAQKLAKGVASTDRSGTSPDVGLGTRRDLWADRGGDFPGNPTPGNPKPSNLLTGREADNILALTVQANSKNPELARDARAALVELAKRKDIGTGVIEMMSTEGVDVSALSPEIAELVRGTKAWGDLHGGSVDENVDRNLGLGGVERRAVLRGSKGR